MLEERSFAGRGSGDEDPGEQEACLHPVAGVFVVLGHKDEIEADAGPRVFCSVGQMARSPACTSASSFLRLPVARSPRRQRKFKKCDTPPFPTPRHWPGTGVGH